MEVLRRKLEEREKRVEEVIGLCREVTRKAARVIEKLVEGKKADAEFSADVQKLKKIIEKDPWVLLAAGGFVRIAMQEMAEAVIVKKAIVENRIDIPEEFDHAAVTGLADAIGEIKRYFLKSIIRGEMKEAARMLKLAEKGYKILAGLSFSNAVVPELKRKRDIARGVLTSMLEIMAKK